MNNRAKDAIGFIVGIVTLVKVCQELSSIERIVHREGYDMMGQTIMSGPWFIAVSGILILLVYIVQKIVKLLFSFLYGDGLTDESEPMLILGNACNQYVGRHRGKCNIWDCSGCSIDSAWLCDTFDYSDYTEIREKIAIDNDHSNDYNICNTLKRRVKCDNMTEKGDGTRKAVMIDGQGCISVRLEAPAWETFENYL